MHSWADDPHAKCEALRTWLASKTASGDPPPTAWLDAACADPSLLPRERLPHMLPCLAMCRKLLLVASPSVLDELWTVCELFAWLLLGGSLEDVEVVIIVGTSNEEANNAVLAAFDAFAVMYARAARADDEERIVRAVELASVSRFNEAVRSYLPRIREAVASSERATRMTQLTVH